KLTDPDTDQAQKWLAVAHHQLGRVAEERRDFDAAEAAYNTALEIKLWLGDEYEAAGTYHQLGIVAQERRDFDAAEAAYNTALEIFVRIGDEHSAVVVIAGIARLAAADPDRRDSLTSFVAKHTEMAAEDVAELFAKAQPNDED
ncbi:MAG: tetratricopeptide repeat protein, partial [Pseudomonadota bacterium]